MIEGQSDQGNQLFYDWYNNPSEKCENLNAGRWQIWKILKVESIEIRDEWWAGWRINEKREESKITGRTIVPCLEMGNTAE